jgi:hypothetical protein
MNMKLFIYNNKITAIIFGFIFLILFPINFIKAQEVILMQFKDTIDARVIEISPKYVKYLTKTHCDSAEYAVAPKKILEIRFAHDSILKLSKNRWDNFYRASIYMVYGEYAGNLTNSSSKSASSIGIGHKGLFRLPLNGLGIIYNTDIRYGRYERGDSIYADKAKFYTAFLSAGIEYRYAFFRGLGMYVDGQMGKSYLDFYEDNLSFNTPGLTYTLSSGMYINRFQLGVRYTGGQLVKKSAPVNSVSLILSKNHYDLSVIQFIAAFCF